MRGAPAALFLGLFLAPFCTSQESPPAGQTARLQCAAGQNQRTFTLAGGTDSGMLDGTRALFKRPVGVAFSRGNTQNTTAIAVADTDNHIIRLVAISGNVTTIAGRGPAGAGSVDGQSPEFNGPLGVDFSPDGALLAVADEQNARIRLVFNPLSTLRSSTTLAGGMPGMSDGIGDGAQFNLPSDVAFSPDKKKLVVADKGNHRIRIIEVASGVTTTLVGNSSGFVDGAAALARFNRPYGVAYSPDGKMVAVADSGNNAIRLIALASMDSNVTVRTIAGGGDAGFEDGQSPSLSEPRGISFSPDGSWLAVADFGNNAIRLLNITTGAVQTLGGSSPFSMQVVVDKFGDGARPTFYQPTSVSFSPNGQQIAVADSGNHAIRLMTLTCIDCPTGTFKQTLGSADCDNCPNNSTSHPGAISLTDCQCNQGFVMKNHSCSMCTAGTYNSRAGSTACVACSVGKYSIALAATSSETCKTCRAGAYSAGRSATSCTICGLGTYSAATGASNCSSCEAGKYSNKTGARWCVECDPGFYSNVAKAQACLMCPVGQYASASASENCTSCAIGKASNVSGTSTCENCTAGSFAALANANTCEKCPSGLYSAQTGASSCSKCPAYASSGKDGASCACNTGYSNFFDNNLCTACPPGKYKAVNGSEPCSLCAKGKFGFQNASTTCFQCVSFSTSSEGSFDVSHCQCVAGYTLLKRNTGFPQNTSNLSSFYESAANFNTSANLTGTRSVDNTGSSNTDTELECVACDAGSFKADAGDAPCTRCFAGTYSSSASATCTPCPQFSNSSAGSTKPTDCKCERGFAGTPGGACNILSCLTGEYNRAFGAGDPSALDCTACPMNTWSMAGRSGSDSCRCNAGHAGADGGPCFACQLGKYKTSAGSLPCLICPEGRYTEKTSGAVDCLACPNNSYSFEGSSEATSCSCNQGYSGPQCVVFSPQKAQCFAPAAVQKFEMEIGMSIEAATDAELKERKERAAKEISNYFGSSASAANFVDRRGGQARRASSFKDLAKLAKMEAAASRQPLRARRSLFDTTLKQEMQGDQERFAQDAPELAGAVTSFLRLRGLDHVRVREFSVKCGSGRYPSMPSSEGTRCVPCSVGTYKALLDDSQCVACPESTTTIGQGASNVSECTEWAGQQLSRSTAEGGGYVVSALVASIIGVNTVMAVVDACSSIVTSGVLGTSYASTGTSASSSVSGVMPQASINSGWGGGGATMALITQVQILQVMARMGGSKGQTGMAYLANSLGWFNMEFDRASFFGIGRDVHVMKYSPINTGGSARMDGTACGLEAVIPSLDRLIWCVIMVASASVFRMLLAGLLKLCLEKEVPIGLRFPAWEGPVLVVEYLSICCSAFLAVTTSCTQGLVLGYVLFFFWPLLLLSISAILLVFHIRSQSIVFEPCCKDHDSKLQPSFSGMLRSLEGSKGGFVPNLTRARAWVRAAEVRGLWKNGGKDASVIRFLVRDYVDTACYFGIWVMVKKILFSAAIIGVDGRTGAILSIVVQTFDMFMVIGFRPYVSKITCVSECFVCTLNWLAFLNLGLLLWPGAIPLQLGETTVFWLALSGTLIAALAASVEALMAAVILNLTFFAGIAACMGFTGVCMVKLGSKVLDCCFGVGLAPEAGDHSQDEAGPIFLTSVAADWIEPRQGHDSTADRAQSMLWQPVSPTGFPDANSPRDAANSTPQDPAALAAYYRQLADNYQMMSYQVKTSNGRSSSDPASMISPVSMSTAPTTMYNSDALDSNKVEGETSRALNLQSVTGAPDAFLDPIRIRSSPPATRASPPQVRQLPLFDAQGMRSTAYANDPSISVTASLYRPAQTSPAAPLFSRRSDDTCFRDKHTDGVPESTAPPPLSFSGSKANVTSDNASRNKSEILGGAMPMQSQSQRLASSPPQASRWSRGSYDVGALDEAAVSTAHSRENTRSRSVSPEKRLFDPSGPQNVPQSLSQLSAAPRTFNDGDPQDRDSRPSPYTINPKTSRADELRDGITRRAAALREQLSPQSSPTGASKRSEPSYRTSTSPIYAHAGHLTPGRVPGDESKIRGMSPYGSSAASPALNALNAHGASSGEVDSSKRDSAGQGLGFMSRLELDTPSSLLHHAAAHTLFDEYQPTRLPPAPDYPAPPPPGQSPERADTSGGDWETGFG